MAHRCLVRVKTQVTEVQGQYDSANSWPVAKHTTCTTEFAALPHSFTTLTPNEI